MVAAHNTLVVTDPPTGFTNWTDPFRAALAKTLRKNRYKLWPANPCHMIRQELIRDTFEKHGFCFSERRQEVIELNYEERRRLWHVPAVMGSMIDMDERGITNADDFVDNVVESLRGQQTMPRTVVFWRFTCAGGVKQADSKMEGPAG